MRPDKLIEVLTLLMPYMEPKDGIGAEHDEMWITYTGTLPKPICEVLAMEGVSFGEYGDSFIHPEYPEDGGITYEEYVEDDGYKGHISFYV